MKNKIEKTHAKEKNNHTHKIVFMWFGNLPTSTKLLELLCPQKIVTWALLV